MLFDSRGVPIICILVSDFACFVILNKEEQTQLFNPGTYNLTRNPTVVQRKLTGARWMEALACMFVLLWHSEINLH